MLGFEPSKNDILNQQRRLLAESPGPMSHTPGGIHLRKMTIRFVSVSSNEKIEMGEGISLDIYYLFLKSKLNHIYKK